MVNASTPADYVERRPPQFGVQAEEVQSQTGYITSGTDFLQLESKDGIRLGGAYDRVFNTLPRRRNFCIWWCTRTSTLG